MPGGDGTDSGIYVSGSAVEDGGEHYERNGFFLGGHSCGLCKRMVCRRSQTAFGQGDCSSGQAMDGGLSGKLRSAFQELLHGAADGGGGQQGGSYYAGPSGREPDGSGRTASGDESDPGRDHGAHLQYERRYGSGTGSRQASAAAGSTGT